MKQNETGTYKADDVLIQEKTITEQVENKKKIEREKKLSISEAYFIGSKSDPYDPVLSPLGYILFGVSVNRRLMHKSLQYLPKFLTIQDLNYGNYGGNDEFNDMVGRLSNAYSQNETKSALNLSCILEILFAKFKLISFEGKQSFINIQPIISYSGAKIIENQQQSNCHVIFISHQSGEYLEIIQQKAKHSSKPTILVFENSLDIFRQQNENVFICYQLVRSNIISFGSVHCSNPKKLQQLLDLFNLHSISTFTQAATLANVEPGQYGEEIQRAQSRLRQDVIQLIKTANDIEIKQENLLFFNGATSVLVFVAKVFFNDGDTISVDTPVYPGIESDFKYKVSLKFSHESIFKSTLLKRVARAKEDGSKGYVIINANNPTGHVYSEQQVREVCEWAKYNQDFIIIFDEMYINLIHNGSKSCSSAEYAQTLPNIQTIRGFAKQFGLCGFKVAYLTTSNRRAIDCYNQWKEILIPHPYTMSTVSNMMSKSSNGQQILSSGLRLAQEAITSTCLLLDKYNIKYLKPKGGVFVFIDLRDYLNENIHLNEYLIFKKLFYEYKVNVCCGQDYKCSQPGWFRLCPVIDEQNIIAGIRRIHLMLSYQPLS